MVTADDALQALETRRVAYNYRGRSFAFPLTQALFASAGVDSGSHQLLTLISTELPDEQFDAIIDVGCGTGTLGIALAGTYARRATTPRLIATDRDALAAAWTERSAAINSIPEAQTICALGVHAGTDARADALRTLAVANIPAKAGAPVIDSLIGGLCRCAGSGSLAAIVVVTPLADAARACIDAAGGRIVAHRSSANHLSVVVEANGDRSDEGYRAAPLDTIPAEYVRGSVDFPGPMRSYSLTTVYGLPEFDGLSFRTALAFDLLRGLELTGSVIVYGAGQGHLVCGLGQRARSTCAFTVADRDCLALRASAVNAARNGIATVTSLAVASPVATVASVPSRGADWVVVNDDPAPGSRWNEEILALASHAMNDTGKLIVVSRTTTLGRLEKVGASALRMIDERRMHGYCARLYRRGKLT